ncbi:bifunctional [glutamate--ammonia ligase]-adenylyl-L-tyrosine phosphorylase/[glutamate--ammonia-ligase] adenylyltransferase [Catenovulum sp. 2E275]|uniref:bifunctional [glutamate--ammonia ligase]-adenylyl-L-tyrosine phosphorylase/[glutamate--ammonia-ligase] adenylyltransferase n=1 Tax=Catenovulum sp. 2E275 TaxID=2980497 RepID=UPI0021D233FB|nr:bifunctional [glutamate--ammonia ligase]-adenylyl-L-tyrosine phosphorylase/[glutamate--ammonia-ligase] adenylyltransferase [Catenovulum sp. 2E275]MCU4675165.1 bifunctional [glutamate--ammonia ligase]-adenylyl-L-tyrosine phosphorylase/[glutamate--ammonia-ligase] adenylyltransferase [Catenovulum sp. 2E275]
MASKITNLFTPCATHLSEMPAELQQAAEQAWQKIIYRHNQFEQLSPKLQEKIKWHCALSDFICDAILAEPDFILEQLNNPLSPEQQFSQAKQDFVQKCQNINDENSLHKVLRKYRKQQMMWIAWQDFNASINLDQAFEFISDLADQLISQALNWLYQNLSSTFGTPTSAAIDDNTPGQEQPFFVLGMGKLGGGELNFSSDIDLIFCYPESGQTQGANRSLSNHEFFTRLGQRLISSLHQVTVDGFVYRVDMRLRPYGDSGPLVMSYNMLEDYYQEQGRDWERYAMLKARAIVPEQWQNHPELDYLNQLIRPFVYRRYIDFSAIESLRKMKKLIAQENRRKGLHNNIKLGEGGIREVEFVVQAFQLIRGGREPELRTRSTRKALTRLLEAGELNQHEIDLLTDGYYFLRKAEHVLQAIGDKQTQTLPENELDKHRLCFAMGFNDWDSFYQALSLRMSQIHQIFNDVIRDENEDDEESVNFDYWINNLNDEIAIEQLTQDYPNLDAPAFWQQIKDCQQHTEKRAIGPRGAEIMNKLMPRLIELCLQAQEPVTTLSRVRELIVAICTRTAYLELLYENQATCKQLLIFLQASPWIAQQLNKQAFLLDELLDPRQLYRELDANQYKQDLRERLLRIEEDDLEQQMDALRQFKHAYQLRIAAADVMGYLPLMQVSDHLTWLAEAILEQVVNLAWWHVVDKHGAPESLNGGDKGFAVLGYGKLGGLEFGYGSDMDLVFVHNRSSDEQTKGEKSIGITQFYIRLAQRIMHIFSTQTPAGILYELDLRLRPSGNSGLLVATINGFKNYQQEEAWTWEHQALIRSRAIVGDEDLVDALNQIRNQILTKERDLTKLKTDVTEMRSKMFSHLSQGSEGCFDLKQGRGGITDIEFITQYIVLAYSHQYPQLTKWSDNIRILGVAAEVGVISEAEADSLIEAYKQFRNEGHKLALAQKKVVSEIAPFTEAIEQVQAIWHRLFEV